MDADEGKRPEILKILQMVEDGKMDQDKAMSLIAMLEGKDVIGGAANGVVKSGHSRKGLVRRPAAVVVLAALLAGLYGLFFYLPVHAPYDGLLLVYGLLALMILCGTLIAVSAIGVGRLVAKKPAPNAHVDRRTGSENV